MRGTSRPGLGEVARRSGYSAGTVSRVLAGKAREGRISERAERAVLRAAAELGYSRDEVARSLRTGSTRLLGLVVSDISNPFFGRIASFAERAAAGYGLLVCNSSEDPGRERRCLEALASRRVDGVLISPDGPDPSAALQLRRRGVAVVTFDRSYGNGHFDSVVCNNRGTAARITKLLGPGPLGFVGGPPTSSTHAERLRGFLDAAGGRVVCGAAPEEAARRLAGASGILFANSVLAEGAIVWLRRHAPERLVAMRLASFDDSPLFATLPVIVARQPEERMAREAVRLLLGRIASGGGRPRRVVLEQEVVPAGAG